MARPIDVYYWPTPSGWKVTIMLEELGVPYNIVPVNIGKGEQFQPEFLKISPNNRMPAIVDHEPAGGKGPLSIFESGAILEYLAEKYGKFMPRDVRGKYEVLADGRARTDVRTGKPLPPLRAGEDRVRHSAVHRRSQPPLRRDGHPVSRPRVPGRRVLDRRHGVVALGRALRTHGERS